MGARGPKSTAALEVVRSATSIIRRPEAPRHLTDEQAAEWRVVVERLPAEWFQAETLPMLSEYCRHIVKARRVAQLVAKAEDSEDLDIDLLDKLYKMAERESRAMSSLATRMRLTQQATFDKSKKKPVKTMSIRDDY